MIERLFIKYSLIYTDKETNYNNMLYLVAFTLAKLVGLANYKIMTFDMAESIILTPL